MCSYLPYIPFVVPQIFTKRTPKKSVWSVAGIRASSHGVSFPCPRHWRDKLRDFDAIWNASLQSLPRGLLSHATTVGTRLPIFGSYLQSLPDGWRRIFTLYTGTRNSDTTDSKVRHEGKARAHRTHKPATAMAVQTDHALQSLCVADPTSYVFAICPQSHEFVIRRRFVGQRIQRVFATNCFPALEKVPFRFASDHQAKKEKHQMLIKKAREAKFFNN